LSVLSLGIWLLIDFIRNDAGSEFYAYNLPTIAFIAVGLLGLSWILARRSRPSADFRRVLVVVLAFIPMAIPATIAIQEIEPPQQAMTALAFMLYALVYGFRALTALTRQHQPIAIALGAVFVAGIWAFSGSLALEPTFWYAGDANEEPEPSGKDSSAVAESLLFDQAHRIDMAIESIRRPASVDSAVFFVGFAGVGEQKVFAEEIKLAAQVVGQRYRTGDRSLLLINDRRDLNAHPLATATNLRYALRHIAAKMDVERDVLFLSLSSHGSKNAVFAVSNGDLPLQDISGNELAAALHDSGIKWRVIVISSCYAGGFIGNLREPHTIVVAAAAADKTSFGCSDDRDLTYFGEAFYRDALPQSKSLTTAFDAAKRLVAEREKAEDVDASDPQAYFGEVIRQKLISQHFDTNDATERTK